MTTQSARERLLEWADKQDTWVTHELTQRGGRGTEAAIRSNIEYHLPAIEAEARARALARVAERVGLHEGLECCDPKTLEHVYQALLVPQATE